MTPTKAECRDTFRRLRLAIPAAERAARSRALMAQVFALPRMAQAQVVMAYIAVGSEVDTATLLERCWAQNKTVALPRLVDPANGAMEMRLVRNRTELVAGPQNIPEPGAQNGILHRPQAGDVILVPGLAFTAQGLRLGQGGGYYDRFLAAHPQLWSIGLAFSEQLASSLPVDGHDRPVAQVMAG